MSMTWATRSNPAGGDQLARAMPCFNRLALRQRAQFALPNLPQQDHRHVRTTQAFRIAIGNRPLALLGNMILDVDEIGPLFDVVHADLAGKRMGRHLVGRRQSRNDLFLAPLALAQPLGRIARDVNQRNVEAAMADIVHRHAPGKRFAPAFLRTLRRALDVENIWHDIVIDPRFAILARADHGDAVVGFFGGDFRNIPIESELGEVGLGVGERHMSLVDAVFQSAEIIAVANVSADVDFAFLFQFRIARKRRCFTAAEVGEDQAEKFAGRTTANFDFLGEALGLRWLLDALSRAVILPAMVKTTETILLDPAHRQLGAAMGATKIDDISGAALAAIKREVLAHDANRHGTARFQFCRNIHRLPKYPQITPGQSSRPGVNEINFRILKLIVYR